jgi:predicted RNase H-like HicB family nuclease
MLPGMQPQTVRYAVYEQDGAFVAQCLDVDVASEGDTEEEAVLNLKEALELYFDAETPVTMPSRAVRFGEIVIRA